MIFENKIPTLNSQLPNNYKPLTEFDIKKLGLTTNDLKTVNTLSELQSQKPSIILCRCIKNLKFTNDKKTFQTLKKNQTYIMSLGTFQQLHYDVISKKKILEPKDNFTELYKPYKGQDLTNKTLLIWRTGGIGDLLFIQPNLYFLKEKYPSCKIKFACAKRYHFMVENWECIDELIDLPFTIQTFVCADYHCLFEGVIERCKEAENKNAYELFTNWMNINLPKIKLVPKQKPKENILKECKDILRSNFFNENNFILAQLRASSPIRSPRLSIWKDIIDDLTDKGHKVILTDSSIIFQQLEYFRNQLKNKDLVFNFSKFSNTLDYTIALASLSKLIIGPDSSLLHIGASLNKKGFGIFGPFTGEIRLSTYPNFDWINTKIECSPCFLHGQKPCKNSVNNSSKCFDNIDMNLCLKKIYDLLNI